MSKNRNNQQAAVQQQETDVRHNHSLMLLAVRAQVTINAVTAQIKELRDTQQVPERDNVSSRMFAVARLFSHQRTGLDLVKFLNWCEQEETWIKSDSAGANKVDKLPRCWINAKSSVKNGAEVHRLNPLNYDTESAYRKAWAEAAKAARVQGNTPAASGTASAETTKTLPDRVGHDFAQRAAVLATLFDKASDSGKADMLEFIDGYIAELKLAHHIIVGDDITAPDGSELDVDLDDTDPEEHDLASLAVATA